MQQDLTLMFATASGVLILKHVYDWLFKKKHTEEACFFRNDIKTLKEDSAALKTDMAEVKTDVKWICSALEKK